MGTMRSKEDAMNSTSLPRESGGYHPVIVRPEPPGRFTAVSVGVPEIRAEANTVEEALECVRAELAAWPGSLYWVPLTTTPPPAPAHPALAWAGHAKDDPDFDLYLEEIRRGREEADQRECSDISSTPTT
jgi:hypothetical protein